MPSHHSDRRSSNLEQLAALKGASPTPAFRFDHVQIYVDQLEPIENYQAAATRMNRFGPKLLGEPDEDALQKLWTEEGGAAPPDGPFSGTGKDLVYQLIHGVGWRIAGHHKDAETESLLMSSRADEGVKFIMTTLSDHGDGDSPAKRSKPAVTLDHFAPHHIHRFYKSQKGRQGVAVLAFQVAPGGVAAIYGRYCTKHEKLLVSECPSEYPGIKVLEVFAYYLPAPSDTPAEDMEADQGTVLRFVERTEKSDALLPGLAPVEATFPADDALRGTMPAYFDHWVSNVVNRTGFLATLEDTLGFTPKVDFNAGVVAAGEAQIESTVTGNSSGFATTDAEEGLVNQSQVYLPINNALSKVGHVHLYLQEIGQGVQHMANRVRDLPQFVANVNKTRRVTGHGFTFLNIPRSYYGRLTESQLAVADPECGLTMALSTPLAKAVMKALLVGQHMNVFGIVSLDLTAADVEKLLPSMPAELQAEFKDRVGDISKIVLRSVYINMFKLLRDHVPLDTYRKIVENHVLVDIQGDDVLFQIFTCMVLQREKGQEAPFLEFIQRVCSSKCDAQGQPAKIVPGCGGFGIRNFLTLFLSIELGKASKELETALESGNEAKVANAEEKIALFTNQLEESNPVLTDISNAMTAEGAALERYTSDVSEEDKAAAKESFTHWKKEKEAGNAKLQVISAKYCEAAKVIRQQGEALP